MHTEEYDYVSSKLYTVNSQLSSIQAFGILICLAKISKEIYHLYKIIQNTSAMCVCSSTTW
jgi:hypothetical protein